MSTIQAFLSRPSVPAKGSFWEKAPMSVGYVPADPQDPSKGFIGQVTRIGKQYRWEAWGQIIMPNSKRKTGPAIKDQRMAKRISDAIWAVRQNIQ